MKVDISVNDNVIVFGSGTIAANCIKFLRKTIRGNIYVFEKKQNAVSVLEKQVSELPAVYYRPVDENITEIVNNIKSNIIFSINNVYIFTKDLIDKHLIINYHNSLLPKHPGRFAEAWAIFEEEKKTGITWHIVVPKVDKGKIILQKDIEFPPHGLSALALLSLQTKLAYQSFTDIVTAIYEKGEIINFEKPVPVNEPVKFHYSWEKPNNGYLNLNWNLHKTMAFLQAMDYGHLKMLGEAKLKYYDDIYTWDRYKLCAAVSTAEGISMDEENKIITISKENGLIKLLNVRKIQKESG